uniref:Uncharacterized protein n=1 Tax=Solanum lycopersicum TaxID=4081 RepID=K4B4Q8_SOLLC
MGATRSMRHDSFKASSKLLDLEAQRLARLPKCLERSNLPPGMPQAVGITVAGSSCCFSSSENLGGALWVSHLMLCKPRWRSGRRSSRSRIMGCAQGASPQDQGTWVVHSELRASSSR